MPARNPSVAGASAHARYRAMWAEHRPERVAARLVLSGAAGVMATGLLGWAEGLSAVVVVLLTHAIYLRMKPGAMKRWRRGAAAERRTGRYLAELDPAAFHVLHDRALPDASASNLDHLVIGLTGIYAIATRRWALTARFRTDRRRLWAGSRSVTKLLATTRRAAGAVAELLADELDEDVKVSPLIGVHGARLPRGGILFDGVVLQRAKRLPRIIRRRPVVYTTAQVATIVAAAERALPPMLE